MCTYREDVHATGRSPAAWAALVLAGLPSLLLVLYDPRPGALAVTTGIAAATTGILVLRHLERSGTAVPVAAVIVAGIVVALATVFVVPRNSADLWSYVMYGRILAVHRANPWVSVPAHFVHDPFLGRVSAGWRHTTSIYGPAFEVPSALLARLAGGSPFVARTLMKATFAAATIATGVVVGRRTASAAATALVLLHPVVTLSGLAGGHNDVLVGLAVLVAVIWVEDDRPVAAGIAVALGAAVKLTGVIAIVAIAIWLWHRSDRRRATRFVLAGFGGLLLLYAPIGTAGLSAVGSNHALLSRASVWQLPRMLSGLDAKHAVLSLGLPPRWNTNVITLGTAVTGLLVLGLVWWYRRSASPRLPVVVGFGAFLLFAAYVLPWYSVWLLPTLALDVRGAFTRLFTIQMAVITLIYELKFQGLSGLGSDLVWWLGVGMTTLFCVLFLRRAWLGRRVAPEPVASLV